jgi:hypothetical protein
MKFNVFVTHRMEVFGALQPPFGCNYEDMFPALRDCLIELAQTPKDAERQSELAWIGTEAGAKIKKICDEIVSADDVQVPTVPVLRATWRRLFPPVSERGGCRFCGGTGFRVVEGEYGTSGAYPCTHNPATENNRGNMGVRMAPAVASHYVQEAAGIDAAREKHEAYVASHPIRPPIKKQTPAIVEKALANKPLTQADVDRATREHQERRARQVREEIPEPVS